MNKELDERENEKGDCYVAHSLRDEDCFSKSKIAYIVTHIFSRPNDAPKYTEMLFMDKSANMENLPEEIKAIIVPELPLKRGQGRQLRRNRCYWGDVAK